MEQEKTRLIELAVSSEIPLERKRNAITMLEGHEVNSDPPPVGFLSEVQCREFLGNISRSTLFKLRKNGLPSIKVNGRRLYRAEDVEAYIKHNFGHR